MNWLDKAISVFSPKAASERIAWRETLTLQEKSYDAGAAGRRNQGWRVFNASGEMTDRYERDVIRARARDLERNSDIARGLVSARVRNCVGKGYALQAKTGDNKFNDTVEDLWKQWIRARNCDVTGTQGFNRMLRMAVKRKMIDGGIIFLKCYTKGGLLPFKLQAIEVDELYVAQIAPKYKNDKVVGGIEYNAYNRPVGYWIQKYSLDGFSINEAEFYSANDVIFYFEKDRPSQIRETSDLAPTIPRVRDMNELMDSIAMKERIASCFSAYITRTNAPGGFGRSTSLPAEDNETYKGKHMSPGMILELNAGEDVKIASPGNSASEGDAILKTEQRLMASGQGMSYEVVSRDMSQTNYSSARQGLIEDEETFAEEIEMLKEVIMDEVYETFLISAELAGLLPVKNFWDKKDQFMKHEWIAAPKKWIDPSKEANANKIALQTSQKTFKDMCAEGGKDWQEVINDIKEVQDYAASKDVELGGIYGQSKTTGEGESAGKA